MPGGEKYGHKREVAIAALLVSPTIHAAAGTAGVSERTLRYWLKQPDFVAAYGEARGRLTDAAIGVLMEGLAAAVRAMIEDTRSEQFGQWRAACRLLAGAALKGIEVASLLNRLLALEARASQAKLG
jgi:hypothetical protein